MLCGRPRQCPVFFVSRAYVALRDTVSRRLCAILQYLEQRPVVYGESRAEFIEEPDDDEEEGGGEAAGGGAPDAAGVTRSRTPGPSHNRLDVAVGRDLLRAAGIDPYRVVLRHECRQYNALLEAMRVSLGRLLEAVDGTTSLDAELEAVHDALARNAVPPEWASLAFSCNKPLSSWFSELLQNVAFFAGWAGSPRADPPAAFRLGAFCFPQALLSAVLQVRGRALCLLPLLPRYRRRFLCSQSYARRTQVSIDQLTFSTQVGRACSGRAVSGARETRPACVSSAGPAARVPRRRRGGEWRHDGSVGGAPADRAQRRRRLRGGHHPRRPAPRGRGLGRGQRVPQRDGAWPAHRALPARAARASAAIGAPAPGRPARVRVPRLPHVDAQGVEH